ncbi:MAG: transcriptional regulator [uncultured archaeon A07HR67]|nr:MAG: transcriptional regulator [uncultured archaeon A07HR67]
MSILGQEHSVEILRAAGDPMPVTRLSESVEIPVSTCYRRVSNLVAVGLLETRPTDRAEPDDTPLYCRTTDAVNVRFEASPTIDRTATCREAAAGRLSGGDRRGLRPKSMSQTRTDPAVTGRRGDRPPVRYTRDRTVETLSREK